jgi:ATP-dependent RNA circularization protein (DNA/RNA ligase family)
LKETEGNTLWRVARANNLIDKIRSTGRNLAFQGELIGEGIQGNRYKQKGQEFYLFDIYDIDQGKYLTPDERTELVNQLGIQHVPVIETDLKWANITSEALLTYAEAKTVLGSGAEREGLVFKCNQQEVSFKAISNKFLLKGGE